MSSRSTIVLPVILISIGTGWLLSVLGFVPAIDWVWTLGLAAVGLLSFILGGWNKATFIAGVFFLVASVLSVLRQTGRIQLAVEVPVLVLVLGVLMLAAHHRAIPTPEWARTVTD